MQVPQSTFANSVFEAIVTIPIDYPLQINGFGKLTPINVGGVIILPNSFRIHPNNATNGANNNLVNIYSNNYPNIVVIGPLPASKYSSMTFAINSPTVTDILNGNINYGKHPIYFGGNRGRGQLYADGTKSNNTIYTSNINGIINKINQFKLYTDIIITPINNNSINNNLPFTADIGPTNNLADIGLNNIIIQIPKGPAIIVNEGDVVELDQPLTTNPNVGGFGQVEKQIVLQDAKRVQIQIAFIFIITIAQISLVIKKKQYETTLLTQRY
jgi:apocytochrome f